MKFWSLISKGAGKKLFGAVFLISFVCASVASGAPNANGSSWGSPNNWISPSDAPTVYRKPNSTSLATDSKPKKETSPFAPGSNNFSLDLGQVILMGKLAETYSDSIGVRLHYSYGVSDIFAFDVSATYSEHSDGKLSNMSVLPGLRVNLAWYDKVIPYAAGGMGFYRLAYKNAFSPKIKSDADTSIAPILFGFHLGAGVDLELTKQIFFGTYLAFHDVFNATKLSTDGTQSFNAGGTFTSFFIKVGFTL